MRVYIKQKPARLAAQWMLTQLGAANPGSPSATCPDCESTALHQRTEPDPSRRFAFIPWSAIQRIRGGRLYQCEFCGIQFYDRRTQFTNRCDTEPS